MKDRERIIEAATCELGTKEEPANSNLQKYGKWYGLDAVAWCATFVSWCYDKAGVPLPYVNTKKGFHYCPSLYNWAKRNEKITIDPFMGDIVLYDWDGNRMSDHTGIFVEWIEKGKTFKAIEGNTSPTNESNGGEVMLRTRKITQVQAFVNVL